MNLYRGFSRNSFVIRGIFVRNPRKLSEINIGGIFQDICGQFRKGIPRKFMTELSEEFLKKVPLQVIGVDISFLFFF